MRLDKYLAHATGQSRKEVKRALHQGIVTVNGIATRNSAHKIEQGDDVQLQSETISPPRERYIMLNKPLGYVCSNDDPSHPTVSALLVDEIKPEALNIAGRLDVDTTGLLLLTTDGQWLHKVTSPNHKQNKRYLVETQEKIAPQTVALFSKGVELNNEKHPTKPATLDITGSHMAYLTLIEGKYHQVKRMFAATGNKVTDLHRDRIGNITLDEDLAPGEYRDLTEKEIAQFK